MALISLLLTLVTPPVFAGHSEARTCVNNKVLESYKEDWRLRTADSFNIEEGDTRYFLVTLASTIEYRFVACADATMANMAIVVYNDSGRLVGESDVETRELDLNFAPPKSSQYFVGIRALSLVESDESPEKRKRRNAPEPSAGAGLAVLYR